MNSRQHWWRALAWFWAMAVLLLPLRVHPLLLAEHFLPAHLLQPSLLRPSKTWSTSSAWFTWQPNLTRCPHCDIGKTRKLGRRTTTPNKLKQCRFCLGGSSKTMSVRPLLYRQVLKYYVCTSVFAYAAPQKACLYIRFCIGSSSKIVFVHTFMQR